MTNVHDDDDEGEYTEIDYYYYTQVFVYVKAFMQVF